MQYKWFLFLCVLTAVQAALVVRNEIPVKVIYDGDVTHRLYVRNLDKFTQEETQKEDSIQEYEEVKTLNVVKNYEERMLIPLYNEDEEMKEKDLRVVTYPTPVISHEVDFENHNNLYANVQEIVNNGVQKIKTNLKSSQHVVEPFVWNSFNEGIDNFLQSVQNNNALKQSANSTSILNQFQNFANNFFSQFNSQRNQTSQVSQQQPPQTPIAFFQNGISQIQNGISNMFPRPQATSTTSLNNPTTATSTNQNIGLVQTQNTISNNLNPQQSHQADPIAATPNPPTQSVYNSTNLNPFANRPFLAAINNFNPFRQTTIKPALLSTNNPTQNILQNSPLQSGNQQLLGNNQVVQTSSPTNVPTQITSNLTNQNSNPFANRPIFNFFNSLRQTTTKLPSKTTLIPTVPPVGVPLQAQNKPIGTAFPTGQAENLLLHNPLPLGILQGAAQQVRKFVQNQEQK